MASKAVLLDLNVYIAENAVRRGVASYRANAQSPNADVTTRDTTVLPDGDYTFTAIPDNSLTVIKTSKPLTMEVNQGSTSYTQVVNSLVVISDAIEGIVFTNDGEENAQLAIIQI